MDRLSVLVSTGNLGDNIIEKNSFFEGLKRKIDLLAADAGTVDAGPTFLGADAAHNPPEWEKHDLELLLTAGREKRIPVIIGSCSTAGTDRGVDLYASMIREMAREKKLEPFKMALIYSQVDKGELIRRMESQVMEPLNALTPLSREDIGKTSNVVAAMGVEQIIHALENKADVILAGRACDIAVISAYPIFKGFPRGISLHMGKALECASLVCWPQMVKESVIGTLTHEDFTLEPMHPMQRATPHSVAAHSMYERTNPYLEALPGGILDMHEARFTAETDRICRVSNSKYIPAHDGAYKVKLEGAGPVGHRVYHFVGIRDPFAINIIDRVIDDARKKVSDIVSPKEEGKDYSLFFHVFGKNGVMQDREIIARAKSHELGIMIEVVSPDFDLAVSIAKAAKFRLYYMSYPGQMNSSGGSGALLTDEPLFPQNQCFQWTIDHLLTLEDPLDKEIFRFKYEIVNKK